LKIPAPSIQISEGEASGTAQMQELEEAREAEERAKSYKDKLRQINQRMRQEATLL